jgi:hypothetical protein
MTLSSPAYDFENKNYHDHPLPPPWKDGKLISEPGWGCIEESVDIEDLNDPYSTPFAEKVLAITDAIAELLVTKNQAYGDSVGDPIRIFSDLDATAGLLVRIDDKLSRVARGHEIPAEDTIDDLIGYLILLKIARMEEK